MESIRKRGNAYQITVSNGYDPAGSKLVETATFTSDPQRTERTENQNKKAPLHEVLTFCKSFVYKVF